MHNPLSTLSRRRFIGLGAFALVGGAAATLGTSLYEPHEITVSQVKVTLKRLPSAFDGIRVAQLSDLHFNPFMTVHHLERVVELTNAQKPDLVLLTGDFVTASLRSRKERAGRAAHAWPCADVLGRLEAPLGRFAVLGNHDHDTDPEVVTEALTASRIEVLRNKAKVFERNGTRLWLAGLEDVTASLARPAIALKGIPREECTLVAVHEPDFADEMRKFPVDFQMSGHSHGGQIRFPLVGALYLPPGAQKYPNGHYHLGALQLYTNRGIGVIGLPMRFLCPPEISVFTLESA